MTCLPPHLPHQCLHVTPHVHKTSCNIQCDFGSQQEIPSRVVLGWYFFLSLKILYTKGNKFLLGMYHCSHIFNENLYFAHTPVVKRTAAKTDGSLQMSEEDDLLPGASLCTTLELIWYVATWCFILASACVLYCNSIYYNLEDKVHKYNN